MHRAMKSGYRERSRARMRSRQVLALHLSAWPGRRAHRSPEVEGGGLPVRSRHVAEVGNPRVGQGSLRVQRLVERLRERKLVQWLLAYLTAVWLVLQLTDALREVWAWPTGLQRGITLALGLSVFPAAVVAWFHGEKGRQAFCPFEVVLLVGLLTGSAALIWRVCA